MLDDEEDFARILAIRMASRRADIDNPRRWVKTVAADLRAAYATTAADWTGSQAELADHVERIESGTGGGPGKRSGRPDCDECESQGVVIDAEGLGHRCPSCNDRELRAGRG